MDVGGRVPDAGVPAHLRAYQALDGEQRHLRVVGDRAAPPVGGDIVGDTVGSVVALDRVEGLELDPRAERVTDGPAEQAATDAAAEVLLLRASPDSGQSGPLRSSPDPNPFCACTIADVARSGRGARGR